MVPVSAPEHTPFVPSPLNPLPQNDSPRSNSRRFRRIKGIKRTSSMSPTQRLLRQKAAEAWVARRYSILDASDLSEKGAGDLGEARVITIPIDEARSLAQLDRLIGTEIHAVDKSAFDVDLEGLEMNCPSRGAVVYKPRPLFRLPGRFPILTVRRLAFALGTLCVYGVARVHGFLGRPCGKVS